MFPNILRTSTSIVFYCFKAEFTNHGIIYSNGFCESVEISIQWPLQAGCPFRTEACPPLSFFWTIANASYKPGLSTNDLMQAMYLLHVIQEDAT
jgi:hypothetical protein